MELHVTLRGAVFASFVCIAAIATRGEPIYEISRHTVDGGGMRCSSGEYELTSTIGQPDAASLVSPNLELSGGFWFPVSAGDTNEDGLVDGLDFRSFLSCLRGPVVASGPECSAFDFNHDGSVDLADLRSFQLASTGP